MCTVQIRSLWRRVLSLVSSLVGIVSRVVFVDHGSGQLESSMKPLVRSKRHSSRSPTTTIICHLTLHLKRWNFRNSSNVLDMYSIKNPDRSVTWHVVSTVRKTGDPITIYAYSGYRPVGAVKASMLTLISAAIRTEKRYGKNGAKGQYPGAVL